MISGWILRRILESSSRVEESTNTKWLRKMWNPKWRQTISVHSFATSRVDFADLKPSVGMANVESGWAATSVANNAIATNSSRVQHLKTPTKLWVVDSWAELSCCCSLSRCFTCVKASSCSFLMDDTQWIEPSRVKSLFVFSLQLTKTPQMSDRSHRSHCSHWLPNHAAAAVAGHKSALGGQVVRASRLQIVERSVGGCFQFADCLLSDTERRVDHSVYESVSQPFSWGWRNKRRQKYTKLDWKQPAESRFSCLHTSWLSVSQSIVFH